ncbi:unnamed protein product [Wickerhamomyces anomalus]
MSKKYFQDLVTTVVPDIKSSAKSSRYRSANEIITVAWNNPATRIAYSRTDGSIRIWKLASCEIVSKQPVIIEDCHRKQVESISWKPTSESTLASVGNDQNVKLWNTVRGSLIKEIDTGVSNNIVVQYSGDGKFIATIRLADGSIPLYRFDNGKLEHVLSLKGHRSSIKSLKVEARARYLVAGSNEGVISVWSLQTLAVVKIFADIDQPIAQIDVSREGTYISATYEDGQSSRIYEIESEECFHEIPKCVAGSQTFPNLQFCPIKVLFAYTSEDGDLYLTNRPGKSNLREMRDRDPRDSRDLRDRPRDSRARADMRTRDRHF